MGRAKQALPYRGSTLVGTVTRTLLEAGVDSLVVVTRTALVSELELPDDARVRIAFNDNDAAEMVDSIRIGLTALVDEQDCGREVAMANNETNSARSTADPPSPIADPDSVFAPTGVLVIPADMPTLSVDTCRKCISAYEADSRRIVIATHTARRGHPIIFSLSLRAALDHLSGGLNELPRQNPERVHLVEVDDPGATRDVDAVADYESLRKQDSENEIEPI